MSATPVSIYQQNELFTSGINQFKQDSQRENDNGVQQITIAPSQCQSSINLSPGKQMKQPASQRKMSMLQLSASRLDDLIIQCQICGTKEDSLIQPCQCENFYHSLCFKQRLQAIHGQFQLQDLTCPQCFVQYKIKKLETTKGPYSDSITYIVLKVIKFIGTLGGIAGFSTWLNKDHKSTSQTAIVVLLIILFVLYLIYQILELIRGQTGADWEVLDQKQDVPELINIDELNTIENRCRTPNNHTPQVLQQIANHTPYPQISTSEIIP